MAQKTTPDEFRRHLKSKLQTVKISDIGLTRGKVIEVESTADIHDAFQVLVDNRILSAPVRDVATKEYLGFLDVRDLVKFAVYAADVSRFNVSSPGGHKQGSLHDTIKRGSRSVHQSGQGINVAELAKSRVFDPVPFEGTTLWDAAEKMTSGSQGIHRVPVVDNAGNVVNIVSQSTIVQYLNKFMGPIPSDEQKDAGVAYLKCSDGRSLMTSPVFAIRKDESALSVLGLMDRRNISGVVVVDFDGTAVAQISSSDLKLWLKRDQSLRISVMDFLSAVRQSENMQQEMYPIVCVTGASPLQRVIGGLKATKLHRMFIVDEERRPIGVVSLSDVLRFLV